MKLQNLMFVFLVALISTSLLNTGSVVAVPNTNFETGDYFHFNSDETRSGYWRDTVILGNTTNPNQIFRYQEHNSEDYETIEADLDLFLVKPSLNLPPFTSPDGDFDHIIIIDWEGMSVNPSNRTWWENFLDAGDPGCQSWCNSTKQVDDTTGQHRSNDEKGDDQNSQPVVSNSTYLIQLSEMTEDTYGLDTNDWQRDGQLNLGAFDSNVPLISRSVTVENGRYYRINNIDHNIDSRVVTSEFEVAHVETFPNSIPFGDSNDQNSYVDVTTNVDIYAHYIFTHYFDTSTGALLKIQEESTFGVDISHFNASMANPHEGPTPLSLEVRMSFGETLSNSMEIDEASSFYGKTRPTSSGNNRIEEGDLLVYDTENERDYSFDSDMTVGNSATTGWDSYDSRWGSDDSYGTASFDVYRHHPGGWDAVMAIESTSEGDNGYDSEGTYQGQYRHDANTSTWGPEDHISFDYQSFQSTATEELVHFFDDNQNFNDDFLYDDRDDNGWRLNYNRDLSKTGPVNDSTWHIDLTGDEVFEINGFDHTWFNVQMYGQDYSRTYNRLVEIPVVRENGQEVWMNVTLTGQAEGYQDWFYDADTGVLIRMEQRTTVNLVLDGTQTITFEVHQEGLPPATITVSADFQAVIFIEEKFAIMLAEHPVEYLTAESADPVDHSTVTSSTTTTTSSSSESNGDGGGLPIPIPTVSIFFGLVMVAVIVRKRKY